MSLADEAKKIADARWSKFNADREWIEASLAWVRGEISTGQIAKACKRRGSSTGGAVLYRVAVCLRAAYRLGLIRIVPDKKKGAKK